MRDFVFRDYWEHLKTELVFIDEWDLERGSRMRINTNKWVRIARVQSTGAEDENGRTIFEDDEVEITVVRGDSVSVIYGAVVWDKEGCVYRVVRNPYHPYAGANFVRSFKLEGDIYRVTGNLYQNKLNPSHAPGL